MKKARLEAKTSSMALILKILIDFVEHCDEESQKAIIDVLKFFDSRIEKPYHFMTEEQLTLVWNILRTGFTDDLFALNDNEYKAVMTVYMKMAMLLDNQKGKEWRDFTSTPSSAISSHTTDTNPVKS